RAHTHTSAHEAAVLKPPRQPTYLGSVLRLQRVALWVLDRVDGQVEIELRPVEVTRPRALEPKDRLDRGSLEPGKFLERQEELSAVQQQPEAMPRDVRDLSFRSDGSRHLESPARVPRSAARCV